MSQAHVLATGLAIGESPRWHDGRLWLANWGTQQIVAVGLDGATEVSQQPPPPPPSPIIEVVNP